MKKLIFIILFFNTIVSYAQSRYNVEQVELSEDPKVLANFIVNNPDHPKTPALKQKLAYYVTNHSNKKTVFTKTTTIQKITPANPKNQTTDILNYLLNDNSKSDKVYVLIKNLSKCPITVNFEGRDMYSVDIQLLSYGRLLIAKGNYNVSSKICNAKYNASKNIVKDFQMSLNHN